MYYITKTNSETGKKFQSILDRSKECLMAQKEMAKKYKIKQWRKSRSSVAGGFSSVIFEDNKNVDRHLWRNVYNTSDEWMPKRNSKAAKAIDDEFDAMPVVTLQELNDCVDPNFKYWKGNIGFNGSNAKNKLYFGFKTNESFHEGDCVITIPDDCQEVTSIEYKDFLNLND